MKLHSFVTICLTCVLSQTSTSAADDDLRFGRNMDYGTVLCSSLTFEEPEDVNAPTWEGVVPRAMMFDLGNEHIVCYDTDRMTPVAVWSGTEIVDRSKTHHTSYKGTMPPRVSGPVDWKSLTHNGWTSADGKRLPTRLSSYRPGRSSVELNYIVGDNQVIETVQWTPAGLTRGIRIAGGNSLFAGVIDGKNPVIEQQANSIIVTAGDRSLVCGYSQTDSLLKWETIKRASSTEVRLHLPSMKTPVQFVVSTRVVPATDRKKAVELATMLKGITFNVSPEPRWNAESITTTGQLGTDEQPYAVDTLTLPQTPFGSWMRISAIDAFDDGRLAIATLSGDVWIVRFAEDLSEIVWQRFATGLYEPLGLKIVDGVVYVRGRDRITTLHDENGDDEADRYTNFHSEGEIGPGYHAFLFDLVTDRTGHFYFARSGRKAPTKGEIIRIDREGKNRTTVATFFRHPNGLSCGGPRDVVIVADNPDGKFPSGGSIVRVGQSYGEGGGPRTEPFLYLLPPKADTSSGSQIWADAKRFGPLSAQLMHTSYSKAKLCSVMVQWETPHPNGFAVSQPMNFRSGIMRGCVNPQDGQLYVTGLRGWDSNSANDGCLQRVRYTNSTLPQLTRCAAKADGIYLTFSGPLDERSVDEDAFYAERIGKGEGEEVWIDEVEQIDAKTVRVLPEEFAPFDIVDRRATKSAKDNRTRYRVIEPLAIEFTLKAGDGRAVKQTVYCTINSLPDNKAK